MLTPQETQAIQAALVRGDFPGALVPLEAQVDLRHADLPRLDMGAKAALQSSFATPEGGAFWARAALHPNVSVRRFVRRAVLAAGDAAAPLWVPLAAAIEEKWRSQKPLPAEGDRGARAEWNNENAALSGALELLLRCDAEKFVALWAGKIDDGTPARRAQQAENEAFRKRQSQFQEALEAETKRLMREKFGEETERREVPHQLAREIGEAAAQNPAVAALAAAVGEWPRGTPSIEGQMSGIVSALRGDASVKAKTLLEQVEGGVRAWIFAAFENGDAAARERCDFLGYWLRHYFDEAVLIERGAAWLEAEVARGQANWNYTTWELTGALQKAISKPYDAPSDWKRPALDLERLRKSTKTLAQTKHYGANNLTQALDAIEREDAQTPPEDAGDKAEESPALWFLARAGEEEARIRAHFAAVSDDETRIAWVVDLQLAKSDDVKSRYHFWNREAVAAMWAPDFAATHWPELAPRLWERFELQLQSYRGKARGQVAELDARFAVHLSERAQAEWHKGQRDRQKWAIESDLRSLFGFLFGHEGFAGAERALALAARPGCKSIHKEIETTVLRSLGTPRTEELTELGAEWDDFLAACEASLAALRPNQQWDRQHAEQMLAAAFYRRGHLEKFRDYAERESAFPHTVLNWSILRGDLETWLWLQGFLASRWGYANLADRWREIHAQNSTLWPRLLDIITASSNDTAAKIALDNLAALGALDLAPHLASVAGALESPLPRVKRWAMSVLQSLDAHDFDIPCAISAAGESLWSEVGALAKDAAKFLAFCAHKSPADAPLAWSALEDALSLENFAVLEAIGRALKKIKATHPELEPGDAARERLASLALAAPERFGKWKI